MSEREPARSAVSPPHVPEEQQVAAEAVEALTGLVDDVLTQPSTPELAQRLEMLLTLLIARGHLTPAHGKLIQRIKGAEPSPVRLAVVQDKRAVPSPDIDCASLLHLCKGRCCAMRVSLSEEDLRERRLEWDLQRPYVLRRDAGHGYCSYLGDGGRCQVYDDRPATCRAYDCRKDPRVWLDWEQKIPAPLPWHLQPEAWLPEPEGDGDGEGEGKAEGPGERQAEGQGEGEGEAAPVDQGADGPTTSAG